MGVVPQAPGVCCAFVDLMSNSQALLLPGPGLVRPFQLLLRKRSGLAYGTWFIDTELILPSILGWSWPPEILPSE